MNLKMNCLRKAFRNILISAYPCDIHGHCSSVVLDELDTGGLMIDEGKLSTLTCLLKQKKRLLKPTLTNSIALEGN